MKEQATKKAQHQANESKGKKEASEKSAKKQGQERRRINSGIGKQQSRTASTPPSPETAINLDELRDIVELIAEYGFTDFEIEREGIHLRLRKDVAPQIVAAPAAGPTTPQSQPTQTTQPPQTTQQTSAPAAAPQVSVPHPGAQAEAEAAEDADLHKIVSPIIGTFYRSSSPGAEAFIKIGSSVEPDTIVCIVEAMKLMNEIQAEVSGEVIKIYVENGQPVEYGQPLFGIKK